MCIKTKFFALKTIEITRITTKICTCGSVRTGFNSDKTDETQHMDTFVENLNRSPIVTEWAPVNTVYTYLSTLFTFSCSSQKAVLLHIRLDGKLIFSLQTLLIACLFNQLLGSFRLWIVLFTHLFCFWSVSQWDRMFLVCLGSPYFN